ncbi:4-alpha-glucanotransferase [Alphaproteobacteria bacterium]|nr:4-alpha-glucanotransferase [Alphaproteobacteria bacterium]
MTTSIGIIDSYRNPDLGEDILTPKATRDYLASTIRAPNDRADAALEPVVFARFGGSSFSFSVRLPADKLRPDEHITWLVHQESGALLNGTVRVFEMKKISETDARGFVRFNVSVAATPALGYHRLKVKFPQSVGGDEETPLIVVPHKAYQPPTSRKYWGVPVQLFGVRSGANWGIGDFTDLENLVRLFANAGAAFVGVNPLNALTIGLPEKASPYAPTSRRFVNYIYIDVSKVKGFAPEMVDPQELEELRAYPTVQYARVAAVKLRVLEELFDPFDLEYLSYVSTKSQDLEDFCIFQALAEHFARQGTDEVCDWPAAYRLSTAPAVEVFATANRQRIDFFMWLQFQAEKQLKAVWNAVMDSGMELGLYQDLPVGVSFSSEEVWANPNLYVPGSEIGAPPDMFNPHGQTWGLAPVNPYVMRARAYQPFVETLRALMRYSGVIRVDHAFGLARMYYVPDDRSIPGAYMGFNLDEMLGILCLESVRNKCVVIAEDLGTPPMGFRDRLRDAGIFTMNFFRNNFTHFEPQELLIAGTHDMPTLPAFWRGDDIDLFDRYGMKKAEPLQYAARRAWRLDLIQTLAAHGQFFVQGDSPLDGAGYEPDLVVAVYRYLSGQDSDILAVQTEDIFEQYAQVNLPGTDAEYPNWRSKLPVRVGNMAEHRGFKRIVEVLAGRAKPQTITVKE